ncbi:MAG: acyl-CoA dehydrogenase family protein [Rhodobiaceae bacterium]|nr:acyl-CoA dehydrogenase family protein [Rhodobiaceae bacterium]MCC0056199.1 acyl-CoA dehydrogenase family protein [Rhodobiaceae bacterium]
MDTLLDPQERAFRQEVRAFIQDNVPDETRRSADLGRHATKPEVRAWQTALYNRGWAAPSWPTEFGGPGWSPIQQMLYSMECGLNAAPRVPSFGTKMVGPVLYTFASPDQKAFYLPRILKGEDWWCQGFSEPGAGSDLASLKTRAELRGDTYVVNGQKIWTTKAQHANRMFCLVRTSSEGRPQAGISFLLIDMDTPGIEVRPIISIDGSHTLNEVFFTDVRVPADNLVGDPGKGWTYAKFLLGNERSDITGAGRSRRQIERLKTMAASNAIHDRPLTENPTFMAALADVEADLTALEFTELRFLALHARGEERGTEASILKYRGTEIQQELARLLREAAGAYAMAKGEESEAAFAVSNPEAGHLAAGIVQEYLYGRAASIYGGSNEIQKNIIAKLQLGS